MGLMNRMASLSIHGNTTNSGRLVLSVVSGGNNVWSRRSVSSTSPTDDTFGKYNNNTIATRQYTAVNNTMTLKSLKNNLMGMMIMMNYNNTLSPLSRCQSTKASPSNTSIDSDRTLHESSLLNDQFDGHDVDEDDYDDYDEDDDDNGTIIATGPDGTKYAIPPKPLGRYVQKRHAPKIPPHIVSSRISKLRSIAGASKNIRHSPWRLNLICQFAQGQTVEDALIQLKFVHKVKAPLIYNLIQGTANSAKTKYGLLPSQLEIVECFATHGSHLKRIKMMGRGRAGKMHRRFSHARVVLREIDFPLKIMQCTSLNQRQKWKSRMEVALEDQAVYLKEKEELEALEKAAKEEVRKKKEENK